MAAQEEIKCEKRGIKVMDRPINSDTKVAQKKALPSVELDGEVALMSVDRGRYYSLDTVGTRIWNVMSEQIAIKEIVDILLLEYDVTPETCENDVIDLVRQLNEQGLVTVA
jgi:hypothetical protein